MRAGKVYFKEKFAGIISETDEGYRFEYDDKYLSESKSEAISLTLPLKNKIYNETKFFSFFDGLIPEGWLLDIAVDNWKISPNDRMGLLLNCCQDCIGAVSVINMQNKK